MKYSEEFEKRGFKGPYPEPHTIAGEKTPPDGEAQPASAHMRADKHDMPIGLSYPEDMEFGPYTQYCGETACPPICSPVLFSCGNIHLHTGILLYALVLNQRPKVIIETGTFYGYSTWFLAEALRQWGEGMVYTIDKEAKLVPDVIKKHPHITFIEGYSLEVLPGLLKEVEEVQFCFLDAYKREVLAELSMINSYLPQGGIVATHDTQLLNTGKKFYRFASNAPNSNVPYEVMLFSGTPHKDNPHKFFGNADDRGLFILRKKESDPFLEVNDCDTFVKGVRGENAGNRLIDRIERDVQGNIDYFLWKD